MSMTNDDENLEDEVQDQRVKDLIRKNREDQRKLAEDRAAINSERKALLMDRLNIPTTGAGALFRDTYSGDITEDAIRAGAERYGVIGQTQSQSASAVDEELNALRDVGGAVRNLGAVPNQEDEILAELLKAGESSDPTSAIMEVVHKYDLKLKLPST